MPFVQPQFLMVLGALAVPIIIHLLFRRRSRQVSLGTLRFLRVVLNENAKRRKLKRWLLLALRMACLALLAVLFARPYLIAREASTKDRLIAILIDRSASMELKDRGGRLIDLAVEQAQAIVRQAGENSQVEMAFFDRAARPVVGPDTAGATASHSTADAKLSHASLLALKAPSAVWAGTNYGAALAWARDVCLTAPHRRKELHVLTDLQRSGLDWTAVEPLPADVAVYLVDLGRPGVNNVAVTAVQTPKSPVRPGDAITVTATVFNASPFPFEKAPVVLSIELGNRKHVLREKISLEPGTVGTIPFELPPLGEGHWKGMVRIELDDELPFDNQRYFAVVSAPSVPVLLLDGEPRESPYDSETYYLETALRLALPGEDYVESPFAPAVVRLGGGSGVPDLKPFRIVVLANVAGLGRADAERLARFVRAGGRLLVFTGEQVAADRYRALAAAGLTVGEIVGTARSRDLPFRFQEWDEAHPLFEPFDDPQRGDLRRLAFQACTRIEPAADASVLARFRGGHPALIEKSLDRGRVLWFTSACDRDWGDWARSRLYLPFVHQVVGDLAGLTAGGPVREALIDAASRLPAEAAPGVFPAADHTQVVNVSPRESEIDRCTRDEFAKRFELSLHEASDEPTRPAATSAGMLNADLRDDEVWHWIVFALVGALLLEGFLANRTAA